MLAFCDRHTRDVTIKIFTGRTKRKSTLDLEQNHMLIKININHYCLMCELTHMHTYMYI